MFLLFSHFLTAAGLCRCIVPRLGSNVPMISMSCSLICEHAAVGYFVCILPHAWYARSAYVFMLFAWLMFPS